MLDACPFNAEHNNGENSVFLYDDGGLGFKCFHNSCGTHTWQELRRHFEDTTGKKFFFITNAPQAVAASAEDGAELCCDLASMIKPELLDWLWPNRVPFGKLTLFAGHPGVGKGFATMYIAARASTGTNWADCRNTNPPMESLIISSEDAASDTLVPRLMAAGADLTKIRIYRITKVKGGEKSFSLDTDLPALRRMLEKNPNIKLVIIDPISNHLGSLKMNAEQELRNALTPLGTLAEQFKVAVVIVAHFNKNISSESVQRVGGAMAMVGAVRVAWAFVESKDEGTRMMLVIKANVSKDVGGLEYEILSKNVNIDDKVADIGFTRFGKVTHESIEAAMKFEQNNTQPTKLSKAMTWLAGFMKDGQPKPAGEIKSLAEIMGYKGTTLDNAYKALGGKKSFKADGVPDGPWYWQIEKEASNG